MISLLVYDAVFISNQFSAFRRTLLPNHHFSPERPWTILKIKAVIPSESSITHYQLTWHYMLKNSSNLRSQCGDLCPEFLNDQFDSYFNYDRMNAFLLQRTQVTQRRPPLVLNSHWATHVNCQTVWSYLHTTRERDTVLVMFSVSNLSYANVSSFCWLMRLAL